MNKWTVAGLLLCWVLILAEPFSRQQAVSLLTSPAPSLGVSSLEVTYTSPIQARGPNGEFIGPADAEHLFLTKFSDEGELLRKFPQDKEALARWLCANSIQTDSGRNDSDMAGDTAKMLRVARQGQSVDPQNAFFPAMAAEVQLEAGRKDAALDDLRRATGCKIYDDYVQNYEPELYHYAVSHPPAGMNDVYSMIWSGDCPNEHPFGRRLAEVVPQSVEDLLTHFAQEGNDRDFAANFEIAASLLKIGSLQGATAKSKESRSVGAQLVMDSLQFPCTDPLMGSTECFVTGSSPSQASLVVEAQRLGRTDITALASSAWTNHDDPLADPDYRSVNPYNDVFDAARATHWERIVLWSMPVCALVMAAMAIGPCRNQRATGTEGTNACWAGAAYGLICLGLLSIGDCLIAMRSTGWVPSASSIDWDVWNRPGLPSAMPVVTATAVLLGLAGLSIWKGIRQTKSGVKPAEIFERSQSGTLRLTAMFLTAWRRFATAGVLVLPLVVFWTGCYFAYGPGLPMGHYLIRDPNGVLVRQTAYSGWTDNRWVPVWSLLITGMFVLGIVLPIYAVRVPGGLGAQLRGPSLLRLQNMILGYLVVATLWFGCLETTRFQDQDDFDRLLQLELSGY